MINVNDVNEAPTDIALIEQPSPRTAGDTDGRHAHHHRSRHGDTFTYTLVGGTGIGR